MKKLLEKAIITTVAMLLVFVFFSSGRYAYSDKEPNSKSSEGYLVQPSNNWASYKEKVEVKGIYVTGNIVGYKEKFEQLVKFVGETELNAMVIDIKDDRGEITYTSNIPMVQEIGANQNVRVNNFEQIMETMRENDIYPIARIVTFKDRIAASKRPDLAIKSKNGGVWRDNKGDAWLNPYNKESWEYPIQIAEEAALKGFKEIQFDYIRFPTDGNRKLIDYGIAGKEKRMAEAISEFLSYARERLEPLGVYVSADVFGLVTTVEDDMNLGQHLETLATSVDAICPMVYPSHYALGSYGIKYPDANPYEIVYKSLSTARERIDKMDTKERKAIIRPWLQDFSAPWLKKQYGQYYTVYGPEQIKAQIKACYDSGLKEWIFWNASNRYTKNGYEKNAN